MRLLLIGILSLLATSAPYPAGNHVDPPLRLGLQIDGEEHQLVDGHEVTLTIDGKQRKVKASVAPTRCFDAAGIRFEFPREFQVNYEESELLQNWTLRGAHATLMVFASKWNTRPRESRQWQPGAADAGTPFLELGGKRFVAVEKREAGESLHHRSLKVALAAGGKEVAIHLADATREADATSDDYRGLQDLLAKTFAVTGTK